ncbi:hypothetical protein ACVWWO_000016 [Bradyrhizobium sp. F1.13.1]
MFSQIAIFFSKMAMVTFGGAYAVLAYVAQQAAEYYHWVTPPQMLDGLGMAETTPGPLIMVVQFVGVILNLSIWFALHTLFRQTFPGHGFGLSFDAPVLTSIDVPALLLSLAAATAIFRFNIGMLVVLAASCVTGVLLRLAGIM